jgi:hypothetical protein
MKRKADYNHTQLFARIIGTEPLPRVPDADQKREAALLKCWALLQAKKLSNVDFLRTVSNELAKAAKKRTNRKLAEFTNYVPAKIPVDLMLPWEQEETQQDRDFANMQLELLQSVNGPVRSPPRPLVPPSNSSASAEPCNRTCSSSSIEVRCSCCHTLLKVTVVTDAEVSRFKL